MIWNPRGVKSAFSHVSRALIKLASVALPNRIAWLSGSMPTGQRVDEKADRHPIRLRPRIVSRQV